MKILALDLGDKWVGTALSDPLGITCTPYKTIEFSKLKEFLQEILNQEQIDTVITGYPMTLTGTQSEQTQKILALFKNLEKDFSLYNNKKINWVLWDERLSSKRAQALTKGHHDKKTKEKNQARAAAFILQSYLDHQAFLKQ
jgi:putative Holliday junction resolvase